MDTSETYIKINNECTEITMLLNRLNSTEAQLTTTKKECEVVLNRIESSHRSIGVIRSAIDKRLTNIYNITKEVSTNGH